MTRPYVTGQERSISEWIRSHPELDSRRAGLSVTDFDAIPYEFHRYQTGHNGTADRSHQFIMIVEFKPLHAPMPYAQQDSLSVMNQLMRAHGEGRNCRSKGPGRLRIQADGSKRYSWCFAYGVHYLRHSGANPDVSETLLWDGRRITLQDLLRLLRFDLDPDTLRPMELQRLLPVGL